MIVEAVVRQLVGLLDTAVDSSPLLSRHPGFVAGVHGLRHQVEALDRDRRHG